MAARTFPTAGLSPIDVYRAAVDAVANIYSERYMDTGGAASTSLYNIEVRNQANTTMGTIAGVFVRSQMDASAVISNEYGIWIEMRAPDASSTVGNQYAMSIRAAGSTVPGYQSLFRLFNSVAAAATAVDSVFHLANSGGSPFTYLFDFEGQVIPVVGTAGTYSTADGYIQIQVGTVAHRIPIFKGTD